MGQQIRSLTRSTGPLGSRLAGYNRTQSSGTQGRENSSSEDDGFQIFVDAMKVREQVFVHEQKVPLENEFDDDDPLCVHITLYSEQAISRPEPVGTIRIVPASTAMHLHLDKHRQIDGMPYAGPTRSSVHVGAEPFIKLGRLAVIASERGHGYAGELVRAALSFASINPDLVKAPSQNSSSQTELVQWKGLVLIHAQQQVEKFWARHGFELDAAMGIWDEEGIDHVAMWKRISL